jgi:hypothetical protein
VAALFERPRNVDADEDPRRAFLRERFKKRYFARATKAREKAVKARRRRVEGTEDYFANDDDDGDSDDGNRSRRKSKGKGKAISDDEDMDDGDEEGEEEILNDEVRIFFSALFFLILTRIHPALQPNRSKHEPQNTTRLPRLLRTRNREFVRSRYRGRQSVGG